MDVTTQITQNLLSPTILFFLLGICSALIKGDFRIPPQVHDAISIYLLLAIGLKGGVALSTFEPSELISPIIATLALGGITPVIAFVVLRQLGGFSTANSAAIAAQYGSVSIITFTAAITYLESLSIKFEGFMSALLVLLEIPGIFVALLLVQLITPGSHGSFWIVLKKISSSKTMILLVGGLVIGLVSGSDNYAKVSPFFDDIFQGMLALFLLEMGVVSAMQASELRNSVFFLIGFGIIVPTIHAIIGIMFGHWAGLSEGGVILLATLAASASYIAGPAAVRMALPEATPALYLAPSLVITFPFNILLGIPIYHHIADILLK